jgi:hypothetical protein
MANRMNLWLSDASPTTAVFHGEPGKTYAFYSVAKDYAGHSEVAPTSSDVQTTVLAVSWQNRSQPLDVTGDRFISPMDVLTIINELNSPKYHDSSGQLLNPAPSVVPTCFDVTGDGSVAPLGDLQIINYLNSHGPGPALGEGAAFDEGESTQLPTEAAGHRMTSLGFAAFNLPAVEPLRNEAVSDVAVPSPADVMTVLGRRNGVLVDSMDASTDRTCQRAITDGSTGINVV